MKYIVIAQHRVEVRAARCAAVMVATLVGLGIVGMMVGDYPFTPAEVLAALAGRLADPLGTYFVVSLRLPRVLAAILVGVALGVSGGLFQRLTNNSLGSPDITGFTVGAATGALIQIIIVGAGPAAIAAGAIAGGILTGLLVFWLSRARSGIHFVLMGMGVSFVLQAVNSLLIVRASLESAQSGLLWLTGSFNATTWAEVALIAVALVVVLPVVAMLTPALTVLMSGDDLAGALGVNVAFTRKTLFALGVVLVAVAVAAAGPIAFVALAAAQLARLLTRTSGAGLACAGLMGAVLVLASDIIAQRIFAPTQLPVGVVTGTIGGIYLIWLLQRELKK